MAVSLASDGVEADDDDEDFIIGWDVEALLPEAVSGSDLLGGMPEVDKGDVFLDCLCGVGASEPSLDDAAAAVSEGLSVPAAFG